MPTKTTIDYQASVARATGADIDDALRYLDLHQWCRSESQHKLLIEWALQHLKADIYARTDSPKLRQVADRVEDAAVQCAERYIEEVSRI